MDIKAPVSRYSEITGISMDWERSIKRSVRLIMESGIPYEFRTTVVSRLLSLKDFEEMGKLINGARLYVLQKFIPSKTLDPAFMKAKTPPATELQVIQDIVKEYVKECRVR